MSVLRALPVAVLVLGLLPALALADDVDVIVGFHGAADPGVFAKHGGTSTTDLSSINAHAGKVPPGQLKALRAEGGVAYVEEDGVASTLDVVPNDPLYPANQADDFGLIQCPTAWGISTGAGVRVAVLDTGCQLNHPDIGSDLDPKNPNPGGKVKARKNFSGGSTTDVSDKNGHGTHTAGTVGARTNNGLGVAGAGFDCELAIGKVLNNAGSGTYSGIAAGIDWARNTAAAKVISMSLGGSGGSITLENAVNAAWNAGVVVVAAAGNSGNSSLSYPAAYANCISVAAVDSGGKLASFSTYGSTVDIAAPGVSISSTYKGSKYVNMSGTSMATPHVAGVAALVWASTHGTSAAAVRSRLIDTATLAVTGTNAGSLEVLDAAAAVSAP